MTFVGFFAIALWGSLALLGNYTKAIPPFQLLFICFSISTSLLFIKRILTNEPLFTKPRLSKKDWVIGVVGLFGFHFCYFIALKFTSALNVSLIAYLWPVLLAVLLAGNKDKLKALLGSLLGFIGITLLLIQEQDLTLRQDETLGYIFAFSCAVIWAIYSFLMSKSRNHVNDIGWLSICVAVLSLIAHLLLETPQWDLDNSALFAAILLGLGPVGGAFYLWDLGMKQGNARLLASLSYSSPVISTLLLISFGLNNWSSTILITLTLILIGGLIASHESVKAD